MRLEQWLTVTDLLSRPQRTRRQPAAPRRPSVVLAALAATLWAGAIGLIAITLVVLLAWTADSRSGSSATDALRLAATGWLLAHGAAVHVGGITVGLLPLGLTALPAGLLHRAGSSLGRAVDVRGLRDAVAATVTLAVTYGLLAVVVGGVASGGPAYVSLLRAFLGAALLAAVAGGTGVLRGSGRTADLLDLVPYRLRTALRAGALITATVLAGGALLTAGSLLLSAGRTRELFDALHTGSVGGFALLVLSVALVPNMAVFGASYSIGPGFAVGAGTTVGLAGVHLGPVPALPPLAALPESTTVNPAMWVLILLPVAGGLLAGAIVGRRERDAPLNEVLLTAAGSALAGGVALGVLALLAGGPVGAGRLSAVGPSAWQVTLALVAEAVLPAVGAAWWTVRSAYAKDEPAAE